MAVEVFLRNNLYITSYVKREIFIQAAFPFTDNAVEQYTKVTLLPLVLIIFNVVSKYTVPLEAQEIFVTPKMLYLVITIILTYLLTTIEPETVLNSTLI